MSSANPQPSDPATRTTAAQAAGDQPRVSDPDYLETLARGLNVMLSTGQGGGAIAELARMTGVPRPSVRRVLRSEVEIDAFIPARSADGYCVADAEYSAEFKGVAFPMDAHDGALHGALTVNAGKAPSLTEERFTSLVERCRLEAQRLGYEISH